MEFVFRFIQNYTNFFIVFHFLKGVFKKRYAYLKSDLLIIGAAAILPTYTNGLHNPIYNTLTSTTAICVMLLLLFKCTFKKGVLKLMFAGIILNSTLIGCEFISVAVFSLFIKLDTYILANRVIENVGFSYISTAIFFIVTTLAKVILQKSSVLKINSERQINVALLPLPILSIAISYYIIVAGRLGEFNYFMLLFSVLIVICLLIINIIVFVSDCDTRKKYEYQAQIAEMSLQGEMKDALIHQQDINIREIHSLIHDFEHQLRTLKLLFIDDNSQKYAGKTIIYIVDALRNLPKVDMFTYVNSYAFRCILVYTHNECKRLSIDFNTNIDYIDFDFMTYTDICAIFSNALENALYACSLIRKKNKPANISITTKFLNNFITIKICNSKINAISESNGKIHTTKPITDNHGVGIKNIRRAAAKYNGSVNIEYDQHQFEITIFLQK